jgi:FKBP-type peptidyl-prolyl cis-trans isomerase
MKQLLFVALAFLSLSSLAAQGSGAPAQPDTSYSLGMLIGSQIKNAGLTIDPTTFLAGLKDVMDGKATKYTMGQAQAAVQAAAQAADAKKGEANLAAGKAFLESNKAKSGMRVTSSGLQYEVLTTGSGAKPKASDTVKVNYEGRLLDGTVFDSSIARGQPATFPLGGVIKGWTEGLQLMPVGSKFRFYVPSELAYGEQSPGGAIEPNSVLIFDVELLSIETGKQ